MPVTHDARDQLPSDAHRSKYTQYHTVLHVVLPDYAVLNAWELSGRLY